MRRNRLGVGLGSLAVVAAALAPVSAEAALPPDDAGWIRQGGNGAAGSVPQAGMALTEVLYRTDRYQVAGTPVPTTSDRWRGWGAIRQPDNTVQLAMTRGGMDATFWSDPEPAWLRDPQGNDIPFIMGDSVHFAIQFQNDRSDLPAYFIVYWDGSDPKALGPGIDGAESVKGTHLAVSYDGVHWADDQIISNHSLGKVITGSGGFNAGALGATQLLLNVNKPACTDSPTANFPFDCPIAMVYTAIDAGGKTSIAAAGADRYDLLGTTFRSRSTPLLSPGGTTWDNGSVDLAKTRKRTEPFGVGYEMVYAGGSAPGGCVATTICSIGVASSSNRLSWTKDNASRAATEPQLYDRVLGSVTLGPATFAFDNNPEGHARGFIAVHDGSADGSTWSGLTHPKPSTAPTLEVSKPDNGFYNRSSLEIDLFANDDRGPNPGIDVSTIILKVDGVPVHEMGVSWFWQPTIVGSFHYWGIRIRAPEAQIGLADGVHHLESHVWDHDGEHAQLFTTFTIDTKLPKTKINSVNVKGPLAPHIGWTAPLGSAAHIEGETVDAGSGVQRVSVMITNQLGGQRIYDSRVPGSGFNVTMVTPNHATWTWDAPVNDPILFVPGQMRFSFLGTDPAKNVEVPDPENTTTVLVI